MNKKVLRNKAFLMSHTFNRTKMFHSKKGWILSNALFFALLGTGAVAGTHASANANQPTTTAVASKQPSASGALNQAKDNSNQNSGNNNAYNAYKLPSANQQSRGWNYVQHGVGNNDYAPSATNSGAQQSTTKAVQSSANNLHQQIIGNARSSVSQPKVNMNLGASKTTSSVDPKNSYTWPGNMYVNNSNSTSVHSDAVYNVPSDVPGKNQINTISTGTYTYQSGSYDTGQRHQTGTQQESNFNAISNEKMHNIYQNNAGQYKIRIKAVNLEILNGPTGSTTTRIGEVTTPDGAIVNDGNGGHYYHNNGYINQNFGIGTQWLSIDPVTVPTYSDIYNPTYATADNYASVTYNKIYHTQNGTNYGYVPDYNGWINLDSTDTPASPWKLDTLTDTVTYQYTKNNKTLNIGTGGLAGKPLTSFAVGTNPNNLPAGYQIVNPSQSSTYDNTKFNVAITPIITSGTVNYKLNGSGNNVGTFTSTGNDYQASSASDEDYSITSSNANQSGLPSKYYIVSQPNQSGYQINYGSNALTVPVSLKPTISDVSNITAGNNSYSGINNYIDSLNNTLNGAATTDNSANSYASSAAADINGSDITAQASTVNSYYNEMTSKSGSSAFSSQIQSASYQASLSGSMIKNDITKQNYSAGNVALHNALTERSIASSLASKAITITSSMNTDIKPNVYKFSSASTSAEQAANQASLINSKAMDNSLKANTIASVASADSANAGEYGFINTNSLSSQANLTSSQSAQVNSLINSESTNNSLAQKYYDSIEDAVKESADNRNYKSMLVDSANASEYASNANSYASEISNIVDGGSGSSSMTDIQPRITADPDGNNLAEATIDSEDVNSNYSQVSNDSAQAQTTNSFMNSAESDADLDINSSAVTSQYNRNQRDSAEIQSLKSAVSSANSVYSNAVAQYNKDAKLYHLPQANKDIAPVSSASQVADTLVNKIASLTNDMSEVQPSFAGVVNANSNIGKINNDVTQISSKPSSASITTNTASGYAFSSAYDSDSKALADQYSTDSSATSQIASLSNEIQANSSSANSYLGIIQSYANKHQYRSAAPFMKSAKDMEANASNETSQINSLTSKISENQKPQLSKSLVSHINGIDMDNVKAASVIAQSALSKAQSISTLANSYDQPANYDHANDIQSLNSQSSTDNSAESTVASLSTEAQSYANQASNYAKSLTSDANNNNFASLSADWYKVNAYAQAADNTAFDANTYASQMNHKIIKPEFGNYTSLTNNAQTSANSDTTSANSVMNANSSALSAAGYTSEANSLSNAIASASNDIKNHQDNNSDDANADMNDEMTANKDAMQLSLLADNAKNNSHASTSQTTSSVAKSADSKITNESSALSTATQGNKSEASAVAPYSEELSLIPALINQDKLANKTSDINSLESMAQDAYANAGKVMQANADSASANATIASQAASDNNSADTVINSIRSAISSEAVQANDVASNASVKANPQASASASNDAKALNSAHNQLNNMSKAGISGLDNAYQALTSANSAYNDAKNQSSNASEIANTTKGTKASATATIQKASNDAGNDSLAVNTFNDKAVQADTGKNNASEEVANDIKIVSQANSDLAKLAKAPATSTNASLANSDLTKANNAVNDAKNKANSYVSDYTMYLINNSDGTDNIDGSTIVGTVQIHGFVGEKENIEPQYIHHIPSGYNAPTTPYWFTPTNGGVIINNSHKQKGELLLGMPAKRMLKDNSNSGAISVNGNKVNYEGKVTLSFRLPDGTVENNSITVPYKPIHTAVNRRTDWIANSDAPSYYFMHLKKYGASDKLISDVDNSDFTYAGITADGKPLAESFKPANHLFSDPSSNVTINQDGSATVHQDYVLHFNAKPTANKINVSYTNQNGNVITKPVQGYDYETVSDLGKLNAPAGYNVKPSKNDANHLSSDSNPDESFKTNGKQTTYTVPVTINGANNNKTIQALISGQVGNQTTINPQAFAPAGYVATSTPVKVNISGNPTSNQQPLTFNYTKASTNYSIAFFDENNSDSLISKGTGVKGTDGSTYNIVTESDAKKNGNPSNDIIIPSGYTVDPSHNTVTFGNDPLVHVYVQGNDNTTNTTDANIPVRGHQITFAGNINLHFKNNNGDTIKNLVIPYSITRRVNQTILNLLKHGTPQAIVPTDYLNKVIQKFNTTNYSYDNNANGNEYQNIWISPNMAGAHDANASDQVNGTYNSKTDIFTNNQPVNLDFSALYPNDDTNNTNSPSNSNNPASPLNPNNPRHSDANKKTNPWNPKSSNSPFNPNNSDSPYNPNSPLNPENPNSPLNPKNDGGNTNPNDPNSQYDPNNPNSILNPTNKKSPLYPGNSNSPLNSKNNPYNSNDNKNNPWNPSTPDSPLNPKNANSPVNPNNADNPNSKASTHTPGSNNNPLTPSNEANKKTHTKGGSNVPSNNVPDNHPSDPSDASNVPCTPLNPNKPADNRPTINGKKNPNYNPTVPGHAQHSDEPIDNNPADKGKSSYNPVIPNGYHPQNNNKPMDNNPKDSGYNPLIPNGEHPQNPNVPANGTPSDGGSNPVIPDGTHAANPNKAADNRKTVNGKPNAGYNPTIPDGSKPADPNKPIDNNPADKGKPNYNPIVPDSSHTQFPNEPANGNASDGGTNPVIPSNEHPQYPNKPADNRPTINGHNNPNYNPLIPNGSHPADPNKPVDNRPTINGKPNTGYNPAIPNGDKPEYPNKPIDNNPADKDKTSYNPIVPNSTTPSNTPNGNDTTPNQPDNNQDGNGHSTDTPDTPADANYTFYVTINDFQNGQKVNSYQKRVLESNIGSHFTLNPMTYQTIGYTINGTGDTPYTGYVSANGLMANDQVTPQNSIVWNYYNASQTVHIHFINQKGQDMTPADDNNNAFSGNTGDILTPSDIKAKVPAGYHLIQNTNYQFKSNTNPDITYQIQGNALDNDKATITLHFDHDGQQYKSDQVPVSLAGKHIGDSDITVDPLQYQPINYHTVPTNAAPLNIVLSANNFDQNGNYKLPLDFTYDAESAPELIVRYVDIDSGAKSTTNDYHGYPIIQDDKYSATTLEESPYNVDWIVGNKVTFGTYGSGNTHTVNLIKAPAGYDLANNVNGFDYQNGVEAITLTKGIKLPNGHRALIMTVGIGNPFTPIKPASSGSVAPSSEATPASSKASASATNSTSQSVAPSASSSIASNSSAQSIVIVNGNGSSSTSTTSQLASGSANSPVIAKPTTNTTNGKVNSDITIKPISTKRHSHHSSNNTPVKNGSTMNKEAQTNGNTTATGYTKPTIMPSSDNANNNIATSPVDSVNSTAPSTSSDDSNVSANTPITFGSSMPTDNIATSLVNSGSNNNTPESSNGNSNKLPQTCETNYVGTMSLVTSMLTLGLVGIDLKRKYSL